MSKTLDARLLLKCCRHWREYIKKHKRAKEYWTIVFSKINTWELKWAFNKWNESKNTKKVEAVQMTIDSLEFDSGELAA